MSDHVEVLGTGSASAVPDVVVLDARVQCEAADVAGALGAATGRVTTALQAVADHGVAPADRRTTGMGVGTRWDREGRGVVGYTAHQSLRIVVRDRERVGELIKALARAVADTRPGTKLTLEVSRENKSRDLQVVVGAPPGEGRVAAAQPADASAAPRLGLALAPLTAEARAHFGFEKGKEGVVVARVERDSPAARAGIRPGSLISMVGQRPVSEPEDVVKAVAAAAAEKRATVLLLVEIDGEKSFVPVRLAA